MAGAWQPQSIAWSVHPAKGLARQSAAIHAGANVTAKAIPTQAVSVEDAEPARNGRGSKAKAHRE
jgi:hypothetical protein